MANDFWSTSDNEDLTTSEGTFDAGGGNFDPIPEGSRVLAMPTEAKWDDYEGTEYISVQWQVVQPDEYANRRVFQKLYCTDVDARAKNPDQKRDKAKRMLAAIDKNAGGKLARKGGRPSDVDLMGALVGKPMLLTMGVWETDDKSKSGNWIRAVAPKAGGTVEVKEAKPRQAASSNSRASYDVDADSIPF